eukprot:266003_1
MALCLLNHFYLNNDEAKVPFLIADVAVVLILQLVRKDFNVKTEIEKTGAIKKNDELNEKKKSTDRALKKKSMDQKRSEQNNRGNYKTHEKRSHHPPKHNIQQPSK